MGHNALIFIGVLVMSIFVNVLYVNSQDTALDQAISAQINRLQARIQKLESPNVLIEDISHLKKVTKQCAGRRVYVDMGANWANTLNLHEIMAQGFRGDASWEVYAFEASPRIMNYVDTMIKWLNDRVGTKPEPPVTPSGSTHDLMKYREKLGCDLIKGKEISEVHRCALRAQMSQILSLPKFAHFQDRTLVDERLAMALKPNKASHTRYTFIPAAAGVDDSTDEGGKLSISQSYLGLIRGGGSGKKSRYPEDGVFPPDDVHVVDIVSWVKRSFSPEDCVFMKWDIEGAEHLIAPKFIDLKADEVVDIIGFECHPYWSGCASTDCCDLLTIRLLNETSTRIMDLHAVQATMVKKNG